jgi:chemotaxis protein methyltransferase CheR
MSEKDFALFSNLLKKELGISMRKRNKKMFGMKISRRLQDLGISSFSGYYRYLLEPEGSKEMRHLIDIATITQTFFFRER